MSDKLKIKHVYRDTWMFDFPYMSIPFYVLDDKNIVLLDSGYREHGVLIRKYMDENDIHMRALIHSHLHIDHCSGDAALVQDKEQEFFLSEAELKKFENDSKIDDYTRNVMLRVSEREREEYRESLRLLRSRISDVTSLPFVEIEGRRFKLIDTAGHCREHRIIITPDGVCFLGDLLSCGRALEMSKIPFAEDLRMDLECKMNARKYKYSHYIAAHGGEFKKEALKEIINKNLKLSESLLNTVAKFDEREPDLDVRTASERLISSLNIKTPYSKRHGWIWQVADSYIEYYRRYGRKLPA